VVDALRQVVSGVEATRLASHATVPARAGGRRLDVLHLLLEVLQFAVLVFRNLTDLDELCFALHQVAVEAGSFASQLLYLLEVGLLTRATDDVLLEPPRLRLVEELHAIVLGLQFYQLFPDVLLGLIDLLVDFVVPALLYTHLLLELPNR